MPRVRHLIAVAGLALLPSLAVAQGNPPAPKTHVVKRGDTLWDIAKLYFNDPFLWPEIYRANADAIQDPHWIYPGQQLRIPDVAAMRQRLPDEIAAQAPRPTPAVTPTSPVPKPVQAAPAKQPVGASVPRTSVRAPEYLAAPFVGPLGGPAGAGQIIRPAEGTDRMAGETTKHILQFEKVVIMPPKGVHAVKGDRFIAYRLADNIGTRGQIVEPTALLQVDSAAADEGGLVLASVREMFNDVLIGNGLLPMDTLAARPNVYPVAVNPVLAAEVTWLQHGPLLPVVGTYMAFNAAALDGVVTGDQFTLVFERGPDGKGGQLPDEVLGVAQVLKVTDLGSTAILIRLSGPGIKAGTTGRLTAKMK